MEIVYSSPGQFVKFIFEITDGYNTRENPSIDPIINKIYTPTFDVLPNYPQAMYHLDVGLYAFYVTLPSGQDNLGTFIVDISWTNSKGNINQTFYQVISKPPSSIG